MWLTNFFPTIHISRALCGRKRIWNSKYVLTDRWSNSKTNEWKKIVKYTLIMTKITSWRACIFPSFITIFEILFLICFLHETVSLLAVGKVPSTLHLLHCARVWIAIKLAPYSQLGFVITPDSFDLTSGDRPEINWILMNCKTWCQINEGYKID